MKDTLTKLRALVNMKSTLVEAIRADLESALAKNTELEYAFQVICRQNVKLVDENVSLKAAEARLLKDNQDLVAQLEQAQWWKAQDEEMARREAEERANEIEHHVDVEVQNAQEAALQLEEEDDIPF